MKQVAFIHFVIIVKLNMFVSGAELFNEKYIIVFNILVLIQYLPILLHKLLNLGNTQGMQG